MKIKFIQKIIDKIRGKDRKKKALHEVLIAEWQNRHFSNNTLVVIGDSHVNFFSGSENIAFESLEFEKYQINYCKQKLDKFSVLHLGPCLAYSLNKYNSQNKVREKIEYIIKSNFINENSTIVLSFGEIDLRVHVLKWAMENSTTIDEEVTKLILIYEEFLIFMKKHVKHIICWGPIATQKDGTPSCKVFPKFGPEIERNKATKLFNDKLEKLCFKHSLKFVSIFDKLINNDYTTKTEYISSDNCHLSQKSWELIDREVFN